MPLSGRFQAPKRQYIRLSNFSKGMNAAAALAAIPQGEAALLQNWYLSEDGSLLVRRGTQQWSTTLGAGTISASYRAYLNATPFWLAVFSGTLYGSSGSAVSGNTFTSAAIPAGATLTSGKPTWFTQYLTFAYMSTTVDVPIKSNNGTSWTIMGVAAPTAAPTVAATTGGSMATGTYKFKISYSSATLEGTPSAYTSSVSLTGSQNAVSITAIPTSTNTAVTATNIYGFQTGVSSTDQFIAATSGAGVTTYTVTAAQTSWSSTQSPATGHATPPVGPYLMKAWKSRMWKSGDPNNTARVYFSDVFIPESWPTGNFFDVPFEQGDSVTALFPLGDILFIFGHFSIYYVVGSTPFSFVVQQSYAQGGSPGPYCIDRIQNTLVYLSNYSVKAFDGSTERSLSGNIDPYFTGIFQQISALSQTSASGSSLVYYDQIGAIVLSIPTGSSLTNNTTFWNFIKTQGWVLDSRNSGMLLVDKSPTAAGFLYSWDAAAGILRQWDVQNSYADDGAAMTCLITTGLLIPGENPQKWMWLRVFAQPSNNSASIVGLVDGGAQSDTISLSFSSHGGGIYGTGLYGTATYGASLDTFDERWNDTMVGRTMQLQYSMTTSTFVRLVQMTQETVPIPAVRWYGKNA